ncbi:putative short-chain dehydrogenase [Blattamonas nauphoetae]|uniref:Short-chain dehydrogenase n=1 Tax=Blattamonas nauphoetae TaxID=2049346 RepID=A0ABQ9YFB9_9EUKA|nr:putative short-chain dehydrogenase [Blattamonas nauphoetae]
MGMNVIIHGRNAERFAQVEKRIKEVNDLVEVKIIKADFGQNPQEAADEVLSQIGGLDISVYFANAGFAVPDNFATSNPEQIEMLNTNVVTHQHILNSMCPKICSRTPNTTSGKRGAILYTSSLNALVSFPGTAGYSATKSYMSSFAQCLALELKPRDVDVCVIQPGPVNTRFHARVGQEVTPSFQSPESASTLIFKSLGRFPSVDSGILTIIVRMLTKIVDANALTLILGKMAPNPPKQD